MVDQVWLVKFFLENYLLYTIFWGQVSGEIVSQTVLSHILGDTWLINFGGLSLQSFFAK